jgi:xanthine dehydrogenase accessory factor
MLELAQDLLPLLTSGTGAAAVTVARVARSAPRGPGATMAVGGDGRLIGSISGGCVESDAIALAHGARIGGLPLRARLGFSDESAHAAGLACGGSVDVVAYAVPRSRTVITALDAVAQGRGATVGIVLTGPEAGQVVDEQALRTAASSASAAVEDMIVSRRTAVLDGAFAGADILVVSHEPAPRLILVGASEHSAALCRIAAPAGYAVTVCDIWPALLTRERFPEAAELHPGLPHETLATMDPQHVDARSAVCVLSHDERVDVPALRAALMLPVGFIGAMGARSTVARRAELLRAAGATEEDIARIHSPLGLDLGGTSPEETALSALAEIVAARHGGSGRPLRELSGPLHRSRHSDDRSPPSPTRRAAAPPSPAVFHDGHQNEGARPAC